MAGAIGAVLLGIGGLAACGDDSSGATSATTTTIAAPASTTTTTAASTTTTAAPQPVTDLNLSGAEYSYTFDGAPSVPAGQLHITLTNAGQEEHQATLVKFKPGKTLADLAAAGAADPTGKSALALVDGYGGPNSVSPGSAASADTIVTPGDYVLICFIPGPDGVPHAAKGMVLPITVTAGAGGSGVVGGGGLAPSDGTIVAKDYGYTLPDGFTGNGTFTVDNQGPQTHEVAVYRVADGSTFADVQAYFATPAPSGPPPIAGAGGIAAIAKGGLGTVDLDLTAGTYVFMCFLPDATTARRTSPWACSRR